jgi:hypothetical protein
MSINVWSIENIFNIIKCWLRDSVFKISREDIHILLLKFYSFLKVLKKEECFYIILSLIALGYITDLMMRILRYITMLLIKVVTIIFSLVFLIKVFNEGGDFTSSLFHTIKDIVVKFSEYG